MSDELNCCPACSAPLTQFGKFWMCPEHGQVEPRKPSGPMRIFLSYGHDANADLVARICADLQSRGHDVWFDKSEIRFGDDWRRKITDGIVGSNRVLSFLSKYSTRDPGVCLDEILIAIGVKGGNIQTILVESETEVKAPASIGYIQWLDMHDWKERQAEGKSHWESWYQEKLTEIVAVLESEESRRFAEEVALLQRFLKPTTSDLVSDSRIRESLKKELVGRKWLYDAVENWRTAKDREYRLLWIAGDAGAGKTAFAAHLSYSYGRAIVLAVHFCDWQKPRYRIPAVIIRTLAFQIATRLPDYRKLLLSLPDLTDLDNMMAPELFDYLLSDPLTMCIGGGRERHLIVIDSLDEATENGHNELAEMLAKKAPRLPDWIGIVATARPESEVMNPLKGLNPVFLETKSYENQYDLLKYLRQELEPQFQNRSDVDNLLERILEKSEGVFLYAVSFCEGIRSGQLSLDRPEEFPKGLSGKYSMDFKRYFPDMEKFRRDARPALRVVLAAREPLPIDILKGIFNWEDEELSDFTRPIASLFPVTSEGTARVIKPAHKSISDWLADEEEAGVYFVSRHEGDKALSAYGLKAFAAESQKLLSYFIMYLPSHLVAASRIPDFLNLISKTTFPDLSRTTGCISGLLDFCDLDLQSESPLSRVDRELLSSWLRSTPEDSIGRASHEAYLESVSVDKWFTSERLRPWVDLPVLFRTKGRMGALRMIGQGQRLGFTIAKSDPSRQHIESLTDDEVERTAVDDHKAWSEEKRALGWVWGPHRDDARRIHNILCDWSEMPEEMKEYDREYARAIPKVLERAGLQLVRLNAGEI